MPARLHSTPLLKILDEQDASSIAIVHQNTGTAFSYGSLVRDVAVARNALMESTGNKSLAGERIGFIVENGYSFVGTTAPSVAIQALLLTRTDSYVLSHPGIQCRCGAFGTLSPCE